MQSLIATTFEVVHYIALQAVHYKPLQEVHLSRYNHSTFKQLWVSETLYLPYVLACIRFYKEELRNSKKGAAIPHLNKDIFRNLVIGIPPLNEQQRIIKMLSTTRDFIGSY